MTTEESTTYTDPETTTGDTTWETTGETVTESNTYTEATTESVTEETTNYTEPETTGETWTESIEIPPTWEDDTTTEIFTLTWDTWTDPWTEETTYATGDDTATGGTEATTYGTGEDTATGGTEATTAETWTEATTFNTGETDDGTLIISCPIGYVRWDSLMNGMCPDGSYPFRGIQYNGVLCYQCEDVWDTSTQWTESIEIPPTWEDTVTETVTDTTTEESTTQTWTEDSSEEYTTTDPCQGMPSPGTICSGGAVYVAPGLWTTQRVLRAGGWGEAMEGCARLNESQEGGFSSGWQLPSGEDLVTLYNHKIDLSMNHFFWYWSSSKDFTKEEYYSAKNFGNGTSQTWPRNAALYFRCIRK